jgi:hypothetical protein
MPSGPRVDTLPSALAALELTARLWDDDRLSQRVHVHVGFVSAGLTRGDNSADAIFAHIRQRHGQSRLVTAAHPYRSRRTSSAGLSSRSPT